jgi:gamma-glutamyltranspeptidase/glutathione hydrolase
MNLSFADRDFYYGDPKFSTNQPMEGLLSKAYAKQRASEINMTMNNPTAGPGDPYPFEGKTNPYLHLIKAKGFQPVVDTGKAKTNFAPAHDVRTIAALGAQEQLPMDAAYMDRLWRGTTTVEAADAAGWVVSITPSGGWLPATIAGNTGVGMSQRMQSFVLDSAENPFNVVAPGKRPRVTLTPSIAMKDGKPFMAFGVQGGDTQDQNLLQFFLNIVEFGMTVQEATEAANINTNQLWLSLGGNKAADRKPRAGSLLLHDNVSEWVRKDLRGRGYNLSFDDRTSGPINAILFDWKHGSMWGGSSNHGEDYGIAW